MNYLDHMLYTIGRYCILREIDNKKKKNSYFVLDLHASRRASSQDTGNGEGSEIETKGNMLTWSSECLHISECMITSLSE